jgi:hypothetical protein
MNKTTWLWFINARKRFSNSAGDSFEVACSSMGTVEGAAVGFWSVCESG